jgi:hypothetical protein
MQKHLPERVQKGQGTMRAFTFENATKIYFGGGCVKEHLLEAVKPYGETVMLAYGGGSIKTNGIYQEVMDVLKLSGKQVIEFNQAKQGAKNKISRLRYIDKNIYLERIDELVNFEQISDIDRIVSAAKSENLNLKNEAIEKEAEQRRQKEEQKRLDKEAKKQEIKEFIKENQGKIVTGVAAFAGLISYAIKKIKK